MMQTAKLLERHDFVPRETVSVNAATSEIISRDNNTELPEFKARHAPGFDAASRLAGRVNASAISKEEHKAFLDERATLLRKKYESDLTRHETNRLAYVRWSLDRIEDAKFGANLDVLDSKVAEYEYFLDEVRTLRQRITHLAPRKK